ncbi:MBL fold metallo-hydrolase [Mucilaginibacter limnophilus]|uniref:MBL fold metallo-hydrolase n=1 Tax=Mucilaginibacter limnophilus TaxID=1932778 RepID=A0A3S2VM83_9SPHI|nr:MBL fold metallo-hydrolase [Mucilaginibacter limnophilus]RVU00604.1 MBL fold metallo-hydrolase [Mucilaginibacter limnophilus]
MKSKPNYFQVSQGVWGMKITFVNIYMIANRRGAGKGWVLVDAGLRGSAKKIIAMAESLFGPGTKPAAIVLTHGHFDHVGALEELLTYWDVNVYAHPLELPYLTGKSSYPPTDPAAGGGLMSLMSWAYPMKPKDLGDRVRPIDKYEGIPELPEWKVIHTPGHTPGHISLFLPLNTTLIAGDAFTTTKAESAIHVLNFIKKLSGPPKYGTTDWHAAERSVKKLAALQPRIAATGHGYVMRGKELQTQLNYLANHFRELAVPSQGRYVKRAAFADEEGVKYVPSYTESTNIKLKAAAVAVTAAISVFFITRAVISRR